MPFSASPATAPSPIPSSRPEQSSRWRPSPLTPLLLLYYYLLHPPLSLAAGSNLWLRSFQPPRPSSFVGQHLATSSDCFFHAQTSASQRPFYFLRQRPCQQCCPTVPFLYRRNQQDRHRSPGIVSSPTAREAGQGPRSWARSRRPIKLGETLLTHRLHLLSGSELGAINSHNRTQAPHQFYLAESALIACAASPTPQSRLSVSQPPLPPLLRRRGWLSAEVILRSTQRAPPFSCIAILLRLLPNHVDGVRYRKQPPTSMLPVDSAFNLPLA
ncbi:hypothetical protein B296_00024605 [Ensete ventricosum]|uniref:Uncharacterized protein n=1 Tax=Ensete ventricosum TaxID=4639 RepID=A0A426Y6K5_ENSVE|nr:hypothetical protein B296_00024605 [Ensete ventricosum]